MSVAYMKDARKWLADKKEKENKAAELRLAKTEKKKKPVKEGK